ncbi:MAG: hypothetical protein HUK02_06180 [Bacteroidaceae bacterium]|nr:hypothetical protein [Bacteroidaceae bacterium]
MKYIGNILAVAMLFVFASCADEESALPQTLSLDQTELTVGADGAMETLLVSAPDQWHASADAPWISVTPATGTGVQECTIVVDSTLISDVRTAEVVFMANGMTPQTLTVHQTGYGNIIHTDSTEVHLVASLRNRADRYFEIPVTTNVPFDVTVKYDDDSATPWLTAQETEVTLDRGARPRTAKLRFDWANNSQPVQRTAELLFTPKDPSQTLEMPASVTVTQQAAERIEDNRAGDSLALVVIAEALGLYNEWPTNELLNNWDNIRLWEKNDEGLPCPEAVGRVRDAVFMLADIADGETLPSEVKYLKYAESLSFFSNVNSFLRDVNLGTEVCSLQHLRSLEVFAMGLVTLPEELTQLGNTLECLRLGCNNFNEIPAVLTKENFPKLRILEMQACRRWTTSDLRNSGNTRYERGIGLHLHTNTSDALKKLLLWDTLEQLVLSYNYMEGALPDFVVGQDGVEAWTQADVDEWGGDTIQYLVGKPKVLPRAKRLTLNLNFFTGKLPDWILYHPHLMEWDPEQLIFNQMEYGVNSAGEGVRFSNVPNSFEYYFQAFPLYRSKYELVEEWPEEQAALIKKYSTDLIDFLKNRR